MNTTNPPTVKYFYGFPAETASTPTELQINSTVAGPADPTHTPSLAAQSYTNTTSGRRWEYWGGAWH